MIFSFIEDFQKIDTSIKYNFFDYIVSLPKYFDKLIKKIGFQKNNNFIFSFNFEYQKLNKIPLNAISKFNQQLLTYDFNKKYIIPHHTLRGNLISSNFSVRTTSQDILKRNLNVCKDLNLKFLNIHVGSNCDKKLGYFFLKKLITNLYFGTENMPCICLENSVKCGNKLLTSLDELIYVFNLLKLFFVQGKIAFCIDTCHLFASGINLNDKFIIENFFKMFDKEIGFKYLKLIHFNGSMYPFNSHRDRHSLFQNSFLQTNVFFSFFKKKFSNINIPFILEFPIRKKEDFLFIWKKFHEN